MKKILVIEDHELTRDVVTDILVDEGYEVCALPAYDEITLQAFHPNLILLDIYLHREDGRDICRHLRTFQLYRCFPIILFSAYIWDEQTALESGATEFLRKPFELVDFITCIERNLLSFHCIHAE